MCLYGLAVSLGVALGVVTVRKLSISILQRLRRRRLLRELEQQLIPSTETLQAIRHEFTKQMEDGLAKKQGSNLFMLPTYVTQLPNGKEHGECYAIDLGGTNFRVSYLKFAEGKQGELERFETHEVQLPRYIYTASGQELFDFLAVHMKSFIEKGHHSDQSGGAPVVGFCFSFPTDQTALNEGILMDWTKGFKCTGVLGNDPVQLLSEALDRAGLHCNITALLNDTIGVLAAGRYMDPDTQVGIIMGTGTNAAYVERVGEIPKWQPPGVSPDTLTAINIEWGAFNTPLLPRCDEDLWVDCASSHPGKYLMEKLVASYYLGEVGRRLIRLLAEETQLLGPQVPDQLLEPYSLSTAQLAACVSDSSPDCAAAREVLMALGVSPKHCSTTVCKVVCDVLQLVTQRSALLAAACVAGILDRLSWPSHPSRLVLAMDGGMWENWQRYRTLVGQAMGQMLGEEKAALLHFRLVHDGSGIGAAVLAAAAAR